MVGGGWGASSGSPRPPTSSLAVFGGSLGVQHLVFKDFFKEKSIKIGPTWFFRRNFSNKNRSTLVLVLEA